MKVERGEGIEPDVLYVFDDGTAFRSPDGAGGYWYDDEDEGHADGGPWPVDYTLSTEDELDERRQGW